MNKGIISNRVVIPKQLSVDAVLGVAHVLEMKPDDVVWYCNICEYLVWKGYSCNCPRKEREPIP